MKSPSTEKLYTDYQVAAAALNAKIAADFPVGSLVRVKIRGGDKPVFIEARVHSHRDWGIESDPCGFAVQNILTGKTRWVCARPRAWNEVTRID
jgi:hypothetical protein